MPIYEYLCKACGFSKDVLQKMSAAPLTDCPDCGKDQYRKQISAASFRLKGQGWYETDFKTGSKKNLAGDHGSSSGSSSSSDSSSSSSASASSK